MIKLVQRIRQIVARHRLRGVEFSIVSNDCWGAHVYQRLALPYNTPFIGLFFSPSAYLRLLEDFQGWMSFPLRFKPESDEAWINRDREVPGQRWPIGCLGDAVEIQFKHYQSEAEAAEKWNRRRARLVTRPERLFFKFGDRDGCTTEQFNRFSRLPLPNKVLFTTRKDWTSDCTVRIPMDEPSVPDGLSLSYISPRQFDVADWLAGGTGRPKRLASLLNCL
jgi:uncharacterized protein (DUF1919 family)